MTKPLRNGGFFLPQILDRVGSQARPLLLSVTYTIVGDLIILVGGLTHVPTPTPPCLRAYARTLLCGHGKQGLVHYLS